jgi:hypothetical protein
MPRPRETLFLARDPPRPQRGCGLPDGCLARGPKRPAGPRGSYVLGKRCRPAWQSQDAREERFHGEDAQAGDPNRWTQPRGREPRTHNLARRTPGLLIIQMIRRDRTRSVWIDEASNVSRLYPSGAVQVDVEHPARNRKVEGSDPSSGFKAPGQRPACFAWSFPPARWPLSSGPTTILGCSTRLLSRHGRHRRQTGEGITAPRRYGRDGRALRVQ